MNTDRAELSKREAPDLPSDAQRYFDALKIIAAYMPADELRMKSEKMYGLEGDEAIEYAYENVLETARTVIKGKRRPKS